MKVYPYIRVSTDEQAKSGLGLEEQTRAVREFSIHRLGVESEPLAIEPGVSAGLDVDERPVLQATIAKLKRGDVLLVSKRDRASRGDPVAMAKIERALEARRAWFISCANEGTWTKGSGARFEGRMHDAFAEHEREVIGERTRDALRAKRARGELAGGVPYGFMAVPDDSIRRTKRGLDGSRLVPVEEEQRALALMREKRAAGASLRAIALALEEAGHAPKKGARWHPEVVRRILGEKVTADGAGPPLLGWS